MSEIKNGRLGLYGTKHLKRNHMMTLGFKGLRRVDTVHIPLKFLEKNILSIGPRLYNEYMSTHLSQHDMLVSILCETAYYIHCASV